MMAANHRWPTLAAELGSDLEWGGSRGSTSDPFAWEGSRTGLLWSPPTCSDWGAGGPGPGARRPLPRQAALASPAKAETFTSLIPG
jgi:hypothetical protein